MHVHIPTRPHFWFLGHEVFVWIDEMEYKFLTSTGDKGRWIFFSLEANIFSVLFWGDIEIIKCLFIEKLENREQRIWANITMSPSAHCQPSQPLFWMRLDQKDSYLSLEIPVNWTQVWLLILPGEWAEGSQRLSCSYLGPDPRHCRDPCCAPCLWPEGRRNTQSCRVLWTMKPSTHMILYLF